MENHSEEYSVEEIKQDNFARSKEDSESILKRARDAMKATRARDIVKKVKQDEAAMNNDEPTSPEVVEAEKTVSVQDKFKVVKSRITDPIPDVHEPAIDGSGTTQKGCCAIL